MLIYGKDRGSERKEEGRRHDKKIKISHETSYDPEKRVEVNKSDRLTMPFPLRDSIDSIRRRKEKA